jgi:hypothetical protein
LKVHSAYSRGLEAILGLQPIHFHWNEEGLRVNSLDASQNPEQVGFNAANVQDAMPEAVGSDKDGYRTLPQGDRPIVAALVNAVKEQQTEIAALKAQTDVLYSAAGTPLPSCASGIQGEQAVVSDATSPTYMAAYTSGGGITAAVICSYNGSTYSWLTH